MLTGRKRGAPGAGIGQPRRLVAAILAVLVLGIWTGVVPTPGLELQRTLISVTSKWMVVASSVTTARVAPNSISIQGLRRAETRPSDRGGEKGETAAGASAG